MTVTHDQKRDFIRDYLESFITLSERSDNPLGLRGAAMQSRYLLDHGEEFRGREKPDEYGWDEMKMCFQNAAELAMAEPSLTYYEGYAIGRTAIPIHHAWCVDEDGAVVDTTWRYDDGDPAEWTYFGAGFQTEFLCRVVVDKETWGVLDSRLVYEEES